MSLHTSNGKFSEGARQARVPKNAPPSDGSDRPRQPRDPQAPRDPRYTRNPQRPQAPRTGAQRPQAPRDPRMADQRPRSPQAPRAPYTSQTPQFHRPPRTPQQPPVKKKSKAGLYALLVILIALAVAAIVMTAVKFIGGHEDASVQKDMDVGFTAAAELPTEPAPASESAAAETTETVPEVTSYSNSIRSTVDRDPAEILPQYLENYQKNNEMVGWLSMDNTRINYPVMQSPEDPEKYLHTNFEEKEEFRGVPFLDALCTDQSDQLIIYAHNMKDGSMFRDLYKYEQKSFWEQHPRFYFDTLYEQYEFEVMAVLYDRVYKKTDTCFKFYQFIDAENQEEFDHAVAYYKDKSLYDTGVTAQYGDQLMCLVTCAYHTEEGKFLVIGRKVPDAEMDIR